MLPWPGRCMGPSCAGGVGLQNAGLAGQPPSQQAGAANRSGLTAQTSYKMKAGTVKTVLHSLVSIYQTLC